MNDIVVSPHIKYISNVFKKYSISFDNVKIYQDQDRYVAIFEKINGYDTKNRDVQNVIKYISGSNYTRIAKDKKSMAIDFNGKSAKITQKQCIFCSSINAMKYTSGNNNVFVCTNCFNKTYSK